MHGASTSIPHVQRLLQDLFDGKELRKGINPEEAAARGAAVHASIVSRERDKNLLGLFLLDATPGSLGVEAAGGVMAVMIPKNTTIPIRTEQIISLQSHDKKGVVISVFEGEKSTARENSLLGELKLFSVHHGAQPGGKHRVSLCFDINADCVLTVYARDKATGHKNQMWIMDKGQLSKEVERMADEAKEYMAEDAENTERIEAKNLLEEYYRKSRAIEGERKVDDALTAVEQMIQQVHSDKVSSARKFREALQGFKVECSPIAGRRGDSAGLSCPWPRKKQMCYISRDLDLPIRCNR